MSGMSYIILGGAILAVSTVGAAAFQIYAYRKKRMLRERYYQVYEE